MAPPVGADRCVSYSRDQLLRLYSAAGLVSDPVAARVRCLGLHTVCPLRHLRRHGRVGPVVSSSPSLQSAGLLVTVCLYHGCRAGRKQQLHPFDCHSAQLSIEAVFGCLNIRSLGSKLDDLLDVRRDQLIDVLFFVRNLARPSPCAGCVLTAFKLSIVRDHAILSILWRPTTVALQL